MHIRCTYCSHSFNLSRDYVGMALAEAAQKRQNYHGVECINCRKLIKVPVRQMKRYAPPPEEEAAEETTE